MDEMKGIGRVVLTCLSENGDRFELLRFPDGSLSIRVNDRAIGVWELCEAEAGVDEFFALTEFGRKEGAAKPDMVLFLQRGPGYAWRSN